MSSVPEGGRKECELPFLGVYALVFALDLWRRSAVRSGFFFGWSTIDVEPSVKSGID